MAHHGLQFKQDQQVLMTFLQTHAQHQPVYFITASPREIFPTIAYTNSIYASRLLHLFWIPAVVKKDHSLHAHGLLTSQPNKDEMTFIDMIADDIETHKAKFILVDIKQHKSFFLAHSFDYLPYLLKNNRFQTVFKHYKYFTTIESKKYSLITSHDSLYWAKNKRSIHPKKIDGNAVVLTGTRKDMIAYYIENHQFTENGQTVFHTHLQLTPHELSQLPQREGKVPITMKNKQVIQDIINKSTQFPAYQFQIYVRQNTSTQGIS